MKKSLLWERWALLFAMFFVLAAGGCGGGGGDNSTSVPGPSTPVEDLYALSGNWNARAGNGTASNGGVSLRLVLRSGTVGIDILNVTSNEFVAIVDFDLYWDFYNGGSFIETLPVGVKVQASMTRIESNKFRTADSEGNTIDITILSETTLFVEERGNMDGIQYSSSYYLDKQ